jgi:large subunit ribosomal protein L7/L12
MENDQFFAKATGRRKSSVANVEVTHGSGSLQINRRQVERKFAGHVDHLRAVKRPLCVSTHVNFDATAKLQGGGFHGQAAAFQIALRRALIRIQPRIQNIFREYRFLTCDPRTKERRKYGLKKARKAPQFSKRLNYFYIMSQVTNDILEKLKSLTLIEAAELVSQIEEVFGVNTSVGRRVQVQRASDDSPVPDEKTTFDVILETVASDKRVAALKVVRSLTNLGLKEAKDFCTSLPKAVKEGVSKEEAEAIKRDLEGAGRTVTIN